MFLLTPITDHKNAISNLNKDTKNNENAAFLFTIIENIGILHKQSVDGSVVEFYEIEVIVFNC